MSKDLIYEAIFNGDLNTLHFYLMDQCYDKNEFLTGICDTICKTLNKWNMTVTKLLWTFIESEINVNEKHYLHDAIRAQKN